MTVEELTGTWKLVSFDLKTKTGEAYPLYGKTPDGYLIYDKNGIMSGMMSKHDRPKISTDDLMHLPEKDKQILSDGFYAYSGKYEIQENKILHHVEVSFVPNLVGTVEVRFYEFSQNQLTLTTPPTVMNNMEFYFCIVWVKVE
ncbi:MAG TPA: hypothetical protein DHW82_04845 [Spirochaetia bacterium]|nr:MAG: hypothetical protein A2Y41_12635 [Spirochaetes bacterium GWB1_36_13]HCL56320.1 hypothetical protein [Spirochaetia bacterium]